MTPIKNVEKNELNVETILTKSRGNKKQETKNKK